MGRLSRSNRAVLSPDQIDRFIQDGFLRLEGAFSRTIAERCRDWLWREMKLDPEDPSRWTQPVVRVWGSTEKQFVEAANTERLCGAFDQLVGVGRWLRKQGLGTFPIRFPSEADPGDAGWHVDGS